MEANFKFFMEKAGIKYVVDPECKTRRLDFYLPEFELYVELKTWACDRMVPQLNAFAGKCIIVLVGHESVFQFGLLLKAMFDKGVNTGATREKLFPRTEGS